MSVINISSVNSKLIGVSYLQGEEGGMLQNLWSKRFSRSTAFFTDASAEDNTLAITRKIFNEVNACGFTTLMGLDVILVSFLNLTEDINHQQMETLNQVATRLTNALGCNVQMRFVVGFLGMKSLLDVEPTRETVKEIVTADPFSNGLILVAEPEFGGKPENRWKAVVLFLDMLRRGASAEQIANISNPTGTVGVLRYGEYNAEQLIRLQDEQAVLIRNLSENGNIEFMSKINTKLSDFEMTACERFQVNAAYQPIHPGMNVSGFFESRKARKGNHDQFNSARDYTVGALAKTGEQLEEQVIAFFKEMLGDAKSALIQLFKDSDAGIGFVENRNKVRPCLNQKLQPAMNPMLPILAYNENGYTQEIREYLEGKLLYAVYRAKRWMMDALTDAYANLSDQKIAQMRLKMQEQQDIVRINLDHLLTKQSFCSIAAGAGTGLESQFSAVRGAPGDMTLKYLVCREKDDYDWMEQNVHVVGSECRYFIDKTYGGLADLDESPIKAIHAVLFDSTDERIDELLV